MSSRFVIALCVVASAVAVASAARAQTGPERVHAPSPGSDGVYDRFDGSLALAGTLGAELEDGEPRGAVRASAHYLWVAGVYGRYSDSFDQDGRRPTRVASFGVDLRPLFLPRFALDWEQGPALLDLAVDSLSLTAGAYFGKPPHAELGDERGFETGLGLGVPLFARAKGPWLDLRAERRFADRGESAWLFSLGLSLHALIWSTDPGPR